MYHSVLLTLLYLLHFQSKCYSTSQCFLQQQQTLTPFTDGDSVPQQFHYLHTEDDDDESKILEAQVQQILQSKLSDPFSYGVDGIGGPWEDYVSSDATCMKYFNKSKPDNDKPTMVTLADFYEKLNARCSPRLLPPEIMDSHPDNKSHKSLTPYLPPFDVIQTLLSLTSKGLIDPLKRILPPSRDLKLICGVANIGTNGLDMTYYSAKRNIAVLIDSMKIENSQFAEALLYSLPAAITFWSSLFMERFHPVCDPKSRGLWLLREALFRAKSSISNSLWKSAEISAVIAQFIDDNLYVTVKGTASAHVFRRNSRDRYQRHQFLTTLDDTPIDEQSYLSSRSLNKLSIIRDGLYNFEMETDDIVVLLSDGVTDNLYMNEILSLITRTVTPTESINLAQYDEELERSNLEWALPAFAPRQLSRESPLRLTTPPGRIAEMLVKVARSHTAHDSVAGPSAFKSLLYGDNDTPLATRPDDTSAIVCYATPSEHIDALHNMWEPGTFYPGSNDVVRELK